MNELKSSWIFTTLRVTTNGTYFRIEHHVPQLQSWLIAKKFNLGAGTFLNEFSTLGEALEIYYQLNEVLNAHCVDDEFKQVYP